MAYLWYFQKIETVHKVIGVTLNVRILVRKLTHLFILLPFRIVYCFSS